MFGCSGRVQGKMKPKRLTALVKTLPNAERQAIIRASPAAEGRAFVPLSALKCEPVVQDVYVCVCASR
jgi:lipopolysaccharide biosynthesis protein